MGRGGGAGIVGAEDARRYAGHCPHLTGDYLVTDGPVPAMGLVASALGFTLMGILLYVVFDKAPGGPLDLSARTVRAMEAKATASAKIAATEAAPAGADVVSAAPAKKSRRVATVSGVMRWSPRKWSGGRRGKEGIL